MQFKIVFNEANPESNMFDAIIIITSLFFTYTTADITSLDPCAIQSADSCLESVSCDVFISEEGQHVCGIACDERFTASMCSQDSACAWSNGACGYAEDDVLGC